MTSTLKAKMIRLLEEDRKREYLELCAQNYAEAVSVSRELLPHYYTEAPKLMAVSESLYGKALQMKERGDVLGEIRVLETAIQRGVDLPVCYERLAVLYSKQDDYKRACEVCTKWFESVFWKLPQTSTSSLRLLQRLERLERKLTP